VYFNVAAADEYCMFDLASVEFDIPSITYVYYQKSVFIVSLLCV
jgi:hypothetical protein